MRLITSTIIEQSLKNLILPLLHQDIVSAGWLQGVQVEGTAVNLVLKFGFPLSASWRDILQGVIRQHLLQSLALSSVNMAIDCQIRAHAVQPGLTAIPGVKNVIAIASGKGGVGKSTTAANLALALHQLGARVGVLDADIYGPNQPHILGAYERPEIREDKTILPLMAHGLQTMSIGYLVSEATPMVWRGPMISAALQQLVRDTRWDTLDYLIVDMPPGTGDIQLTLAKKVPVTAVVMVTTPQDVALLDVRKGLEMFRKVDVNVLGIIENMSMHTCSQCGHQEPLFGAGGGQRLADLCKAPMLGQLPLALAIREDADRGMPTVVAEPHGSLARHYHQIALTIAMRLSQLKINYGSRLPGVVVE